MYKTTKLFTLSLTLGLLSLGACKTVNNATGGVRIVGDHLELDRHVHFASGEAVILEDSHDLLNRVATVLKARDDIALVRVNGHTDMTGSPEGNLTLSESRAAAVVEYLRGQGVGSELVSKGFGQTEPVCQEATSECNAKNRRVEFLIEWKG